MKFLRGSFFALTLVLITLFFFSNCISVNLSKESVKSKNVEYLQPQAPYLPIQVAGADRAWKSEKSGATISYLSECSSQIVSPESIRDDSLSFLPQAKVLQEKKISFDGREALRTLAEGKVEGIAVHSDLLTFQKNGCRYILSHVGRAQNLKSESTQFEKFLDGFRAP